VPHHRGADKWLEPDEGRLSCPVLRGQRRSNAPLLPDDAGWGMLKTLLQYKGQQAGRSVRVVSERNTTRTCSSCGALTGPTGLDKCAVRSWMCGECGDTHDRDVNAAKNILATGRMPPPVSGNESSSSGAPTSPANRRGESGKSALKKAA
jgi:transposase